MAIELKVPQLGESITEVVIGAWLKHSGDAVARDEALVELESDKATVELPAPEAGTLGEILKQQGDTAAVGEVVAYLEKNGGGKSKPAAKQKEEKKPEPKAEKREKPAGAKAEKPRKEKPAKQEEEPEPEREHVPVEPRIMPAAQRALAEHGLRSEDVEPTGPGGRILKEDVERAARHEAAPAAPEPPRPEPAAGREEEVVPMTPLRLRVAERLVEAQRTAALLTTFNEVDMSAVMALRREHGEAFQQQYDIKLGFMGFFVKACVDALGHFPALNAEIREDKIVYRNYYDIGIAIAGGKGLVVPVIQGAERLSFAEIETSIADFATRARQNKLKIEELYGGTFSITNGGVFGSLLSTPIVNPPQSGILGMHAIQERPVARNGEVVIRPMMYLALTYDHRIVDGREAVQFLVRIKHVIENPARLLLEV